MRLTKDTARLILIEASARNLSENMFNEEQFRQDICRGGFVGFENMTIAELVQNVHDAGIIEFDDEVAEAAEFLEGMT